MKSLSIAFLVLLSVCFSNFAEAGGKSKTVAAPPPESKSTVASVNAATNQVTIDFKNSSYTAAKHSTTYTIDALTTITANNVPGKFSDIHPGMIVLGTTERDAHTLDNITLGGSGLSPAPAAKPAAKPKAK